MNRYSWLSLGLAVTACVESSSGPLQSGPSPECTTDAQCALNFVCAASECVFVGCVEDQECNAGESCDATGSCVAIAQCASDAQCRVGEVCFGGDCYVNTGGAGGGGGGAGGGGGGAGGGGGGGGGGATGALDPGGWLWNGSAVLEGGRINATFNRLGASLRGSHGTRIAYDCDADLPGSPSGSTVYGTGVYTDDSSICRAAIHAGVIPSSGGRVLVEVRPGAASYSGSLRNGVTSLSYGAWTGSFALVP